MASVVIRPNESQDNLLRRFRKKVVKSGVLSTVRRKRWFISKSELRRVEKKKAGLSINKWRARQLLPGTKLRQQIKPRFDDSVSRGYFIPCEGR